jgi:Uma2 family endonuclease
MKLINQAVAGSQLVRRFTLAEFTEICHSLPEDRLELINGEVLSSTIPDSAHIQQTMKIESLLHANYAEVNRLGYHVAGSYAWYSVNRELDHSWIEWIAKGSDYVCPDVSICLRR